MDKERTEQIDRWAEHVRTHPDWKKIHNRFIDAQFDMARRFWERMEAQPGGKQRLRELYGIKNPKAAPGLFENESAQPKISPKTKISDLAGS